MTREEFEHAIRAAGAIVDARELLVIGSQALHGSVEGDLPPEATRSVEVDVAAMNNPEEDLADLIDGSIGEGSMFHATFGYFVQGVVSTTAILPAGWRRRLVRFETPATNGVVAWCLEPHDLWVSKAVAGRPKDVEFCRALLEDGFVSDATLRQRLSKVRDLDVRVRSRVQAWIAREDR